MAKREEHDRSGGALDPPQVLAVEIVTPVNPDRPTPRERIAAVHGPARRRPIVALALLIAIVGAGTAALAGVDLRGGRARPLARERGPEGVAAAYGYPLRCLSVTILAGNRAYARADFNHVSACGRYTGYSTAIFHRVSGAWRPVLNAVSYVCPVAMLPPGVQARLGVCP
jgi:hypothetical protein